MYNSLLLNIIKFFLALTVLVSHLHIFGKSQEYFHICVDAFMIISGFTLTTGYKNDADFNYTKYLYRRLLRIYPMFFCI